MMLVGTGDFNLNSRHMVLVGGQVLLSCGRDEVLAFTGYGSVAFKDDYFYSSLVMELKNYRPVRGAELCSLAHGILLNNSR